MAVLASLNPETARNALLILLGIGYFGYHLRGWWRHHAGKAKTEKGKKSEVKAEPKAEVVVERSDAAEDVRKEASLTPCKAAERSVEQFREKEEDNSSSLSFGAPPVHDFTFAAEEEATGEELYNQARSIPHHEIPDFEKDGRYLKLLEKSVAAGYAPAMAKLGEYAMRRAAWVEAYYWMKLAERNGLHGLLPIMREIRTNWSLDGFPNEGSNVNPLFSAEAGSIGRALLHIDSGRETMKAKEFLQGSSFAKPES